MANNLKHDLRTPLNHIIGYCEMLMEEAEDLPQKQFAADLQRIHFAGKNLLTVVNHLFDPVKSAAYTSDPGLFHHEIRTPLNQIIGYAEMLQEEARDLGMDGFVADFDRILSAAAELLRLIVQHFGADEFQLGRTETPPDPHASVFIRRRAAVPAPAPTANPKTDDEKSSSILVVDDDEGNRDMIGRRLERLGLRVTFAENGRRALEELQNASFDLVLLDIQMPEMDGHQVLERMKADPASRDIPVIVLSASVDTPQVARCIEAGAEDYLPKPFDPVLLQARIGASLEKRRLRRREVAHLRLIQEEKQRSDDLLHIILPHDVAAELKANNSVKPRRFENVGVLFCDIVAFTAYCDQHAPEEIHTHLQALVEAFETIVHSHGLEKIKTIGDSLMATAGMLIPAENPALECARCGLEMIAASRKLPPHWQIRVGVHAGPLIAGVVGRRKYQYDIWGDTVNTAARMMQAASPGATFVTSETWKALAAHCEGSRQGIVQIKGKGELTLYSVESVRSGRQPGIIAS